MFARKGFWKDGVAGFAEILARISGETLLVDFADIEGRSREHEVEADDGVLEVLVGSGDLTVPFLRRNDSKVVAPYGAKLGFGGKGAAFEDVVAHRPHVGQVRVFLLEGHAGHFRFEPPKPSGFFRVFFSSEIRRRSTFFTSSSGRKDSGRMPRSMRVWRTASLLVTCSLEMADSLERR